jgi:hypothetical protein
MQADKGRKFAEGGEMKESKTASKSTEKKDGEDSLLLSAGKNAARRAMRARNATISALGGTALGISAAIERLRDKEESDKNLKRAKNAFRSAGRSAKAIFAGEPADNIEGDILKTEGNLSGELLPGAEKIEYRTGGSVKQFARRADGIASRGKTRGKFI